MDLTPTTTTSDSSHISTCMLANALIAAKVETSDEKPEDNTAIENDPTDLLADAQNEFYVDDTANDQAASQCGHKGPNNPFIKLYFIKLYCSVYSWAYGENKFFFKTGGPVCKFLRNWGGPSANF